ncbi:rab geranylgeranyltransferase [Malassezia pachydermatis]|uniref:Geranylgeranyl transferase type-2 subunit beta n=1 Tax=Malassezia pachydermatis TaxID=77020 RepID=A0A0M8MLD3_9BASI|nr:rab geranylgeranyltransferase [Malassezia pachydermatis]KOS13898.1 rab geranylgeranyltransferase [Malassezia pachydermatis]
MASTLLLDKHVQFIKKLEKKRDSSLAYHMTAHLRMNGVYWGLCALALMEAGDELDRDALVEFVLSCYDPSTGGFGSYPKHDSHILSTLSAIQILALKDALDPTDHAVILQLQLPNGSFQGDRWGETDTRFLYCATSALAHLGALDRLDQEKTISWILRCANFDGGFGLTEGAESHAAQVFTCVGALSILNALDRIDQDTLAWWLAERQVPAGGLNGRPQKLEDVCYSWWVLSSLSLLHRLHWIDAQKLEAFILSAQDPDGGGIADRADNVADVFHTQFGVAGLSLLGYPGLAKVDPTYCMPLALTKKLGIDRPFQQ